MGKITNQANLELNIIDEDMAPISAGRVSNQGMHIPDLELIDAKNAMPTLTGYTSFFGKGITLETTTLDVNCQEVISYRTIHGDNIQIAFAEFGLYARSLAGDGTGVVTVVPAAGDDPEHTTLDLDADGKCSWEEIIATKALSPWQLWTYALLENKLYIYRKGLDYFIRLTSYKPGQVVFEHLVPDYIIGSGKAHSWTVSASDSSTGDDTWKAMQITTSNGLDFGIQKSLLASAAQVANAPKLMQEQILNTGLISCSLSETSRTETPIEAHITIRMDKQDVIDNINIAHNAPDEQLKVEVIDGDPLALATQVTPPIDFSSMIVSNYHSIGYNEDGTYMHLFAYGTVHRFPLATAYDPRTADFSSATLGTVHLRGGLFNADGTSIYTLDISDSTKVYEYPLTIAYDPTTASVGTRILLFTTTSKGMPAGYPTDMKWNGDGSKLYIPLDDKIYELSLSTNKDMSTAGAATVAVDYNALIYIEAMDFSSDGSTLFLTMWAAVAGVYAYHLPTNFDVSTSDTPPDWPFGGAYGHAVGSYRYLLISNVDEGIDINYCLANLTKDTIYCIDYVLEAFYEYEIEYIITGVVDITGFRKTLPTVIAVDGTAEYIPEGSDNDYVAARIEALLLLNPVVSPYMLSLVVTQSQEAQVAYTLDINLYLLDGTDVPTLTLTQDGTTLWSKSALVSVDAPLGHVEGITKGKARLAAWDEVGYVYWGDTATKIAFTPSPATRANQVTVPAAAGKIVLCKEYEDGFIIYTTNNIVQSAFVGGEHIFKMEAFKDSKGIIDPRHLAARDNLHIAWTTDGLSIIDPLGATTKPMAPGLVDYIHKYRYPITLGLLSDRFVVIYLQDRDITTSNRALRNSTTSLASHLPAVTMAGFGYSKIGPGLNLYPTYLRGLVFDTQLSKWGSVDGDMRMLSSTLPYNQSAFNLSKDYYHTSATLGDEERSLLIMGTDGYSYVATNAPTDSYLCFGHYATHRLRDTKLVAIQAEFIGHPDAQLGIERSHGGYDIDWDTNPSDVAMNDQQSIVDMWLVGRWMNILVKGRYHLNRLLTSGYNYGRKI